MEGLDLKEGCYVDEALEVDYSKKELSNSASLNDWLVNSIVSNLKSEIRKQAKEESENIDNSNEDKKIQNFNLDAYRLVTNLDYKNYFTHAKKWVGHIIEIQKNSFTAKLQEIDSSTTYEIADFDFDEITPEDHALIKMGAAFYWSIGMNVKNGQVTRESIVRFQRLNRWSETDYDEAADRASDWLSNWGSDK